MSASGSRLGDRLREGVALLAVVVPVVFLWAPLREAHFHGDDFVHLYDYTTRPLWALLGEPWGGHVLGLYHLVFWSAFQVFGTEPRGYHVSLVVLHAVNAALLCVVVRRITTSVALAAVGGLLWGTSPALVGTLSWISVQGEVVLTTLVLIVFAGLARRWSVPTAVPRRTVVGWVLVLALGSTAFGMGLGVAVAFPVAAILAFGPAQLGRGNVVVLVLGALCTVVAYGVLLHFAAPRESDVVAVALRGSWLSPLVFLGSLLLAGAGGLLLSPFVAVTDVPADAVAAIVLVGLAAWGFTIGDGRVRRAIVVAGVLGLAVYGSVSMGRAAAYDLTDASLVAMARESRYQYLPLALLTVLLCAAGRGIMDAGRRAGALVLACAALWVVARGVASVHLPLALPMWEQERADQDELVRTIWDAVRTTRPGGIVWIHNRPFRPTQALGAFMPGWAGMYVVLFPANRLAGHEVRFLASKDDWEHAQARGGRIGWLVIERGHFAERMRAAP